tara:strand:+ start:5856 stop:6581 length:726 start_codon:yes stop_codon:yes gene_type:complete
MIIEQLRVFGNLALFAQANRFNNNLSNQKMKADQYSLEGDFIQYTILPLELVKLGQMKGKGITQYAQDIACALSCEFTVRNGGGCYVNNEIRTAIKSAHKVLNSRSLSFKAYNPKIRLTVWGDVGRLNAEGKAYILNLAQNADRLSYTADFQKESMQKFKGFFLASVQSIPRLLTAQSLGWKSYIADSATYEFVKVQGIENLYKCPQNNKGDAVRFGCSTCKIACNGLRSVVAYSVHSQAL